MIINKQDTNGSKALLPAGELGFDNYPAGGDKGRVYVGRGDINVPLANKAEADAAVTAVGTHAARVDNPHSVTKIQVGLSNVDNTADSTKVVDSAGKWTTGRLINGTTVDGTVNITTSQWGASRNITIGNTLKTVNGSGDVSWTLTEIGAIGTSSPVFTGVPTAPTAPVNTNSTQIATTAYVASQVANTAVALTGSQTVDGVKTFSSNIIGSITGNSGSATKLATARTINGVAFDGSANITVSDTTAVKLTGNETIAGVKTFSSNIIGSITGNAGSATIAADSNKLVGKNWYWSGQGGQPAWLWGGSDGTNMYVYNPSNFSVNYANSATYAAAFTTAVGSAPSYACRAWVNFNGTGTVAIRASGNVSSITDNNVGDYTVNFTTAMPDTNYSCSGLVRSNTDATNTGTFLHTRLSSIKTVSALQVLTVVTYAGLNALDIPEANVAIFR